MSLDRYPLGRRCRCRGMVYALTLEEEGQRASAPRAARRIEPTGSSAPSAAPRSPGPVRPVVPPTSRASASAANAGAPWTRRGSRPPGTEVRPGDRRPALGDTTAPAGRRAAAGLGPVRGPGRFDGDGRGPRPRGRPGGPREPTSRPRGRSSSDTAGRSRSSSGTPSWRSGAPRPPTRMTPSGPCAPGSTWSMPSPGLRGPTGAPDLAARAAVLTGEAAVTLGAQGQGLVAGDLVNSAARLQGVAAPGHRARRRGDRGRDTGRDRVRAGRGARGQGQGDAHRRMAGDAGRGRSPRRRSRRPARGAVRRARDRAAGAQGRARRDRVGATRAVCGDHRPGRHRQEPPRVGAGEARRWPGRAGLLASWSIAGLRRGHRLLGAGRDGPEPGGAAGDRPTERSPRRSWPWRSRHTWPMPRTVAGSSPTCASCSVWRVRPAATAASSSGPGDGSSRPSAPGARPSSPSRISNGPTMACSTSSTRCSSGRAAIPSWSSCSPAPSSWSGVRGWVPRAGTPSPSTWSRSIRPRIRELLAGLAPELEPVLVDARGRTLGGHPAVRHRARADAARRRRGGSHRCPPTGWPSRRLSRRSSRLASTRCRQPTAPCSRTRRSSGQSFTIPALAAVSGEDPAALEGRLRVLVRREFLSLEADPRSPERGQYAFVQSVVHEVAYGTLARRDRRSRHLAAARYVDSLGDESMATVVAAHYLEAYRAAPDDEQGRVIRAQARVALRGAAERSARLHNYEQAVRDLERALELTDDADRAGGAPHPAGRVERGRCPLPGGGRRPLNVPARRMRRSVTIGPRASRRPLLGRIEMKRGHWDEAAALLERSLSDLDPSVRPRDLRAIRGRIRADAHDPQPRRGGRGLGRARARGRWTGPRWSRSSPRR